MKHAAFFEGLRHCLFAFYLLPLTSYLCHAALPRSWQVNAGVGRVVDLPAVFHGEEVELRADFVGPDGQPFTLPEGDWKLYFQTNGMDALYFGPFPASASSNSVTAVFSPTNDPGAAQITGYLSLPGSIYHAAFRLRFLPSPGATPNALALPTPTLNFATTTILNPPWPAEIEALSNTLSQAIADATPADYANVSNLAYSAIQPDTLASVSNGLTEAIADATPADYANVSNLAYSAIQPDTLAAAKWTWASITNVPSATTATKGVVLLSSSTNSASTTYAATSAAVRSVAITANDAAKGAAANAANIASHGTRLLAAEQGLAAIPDWAKAASKPSYTLNDVCPETENWLGKPGTTAAGKSIKVLAKTVNGVIEGGMTVTGSSNNDNNTTKYRYGGVTSTRSGVNTDYLWDDSPNGIVRNSQLTAEVQRIDTITSYLAGGDAKVVFTNDPQRVWAPMHSYHVKTGNVWQVIWDEAEVASSNALEMAELRSALDDKADRAWGYYDSHTGNWSPDGYTWVSSPKIGIGGGLAYQRVAATEGAIWVLCSNGLVAQTGGTTNGYFRVEDDEGNAQLEIVKGDRRTVGANPASLTTSVSGGRTHLNLTYAIQSAEHPVLRIAADISNPVWLPETDPDCVANVTWSGQSGGWTADVSGKQAYSTLFVKGEYAVGGESLINAPIPLKLSHIYIGSQKYAIGTATIDGITVLTLTPTL